MGEIELDSDIENLKLLRKQLQSVHAIRMEQKRKDDTISRLRERIKALERQQVTYEELQEEFVIQVRRMSSLQEEQLETKIADLNSQLSSLQEQVIQLTEQATDEKMKLEEAQLRVDSYKSKCEKLKKLYYGEKQKSDEAAEEISRLRREFVEKEACLSLEITRSDDRIAALESSVRAKEEVLQQALNDLAVQAAQSSAQSAQAAAQASQNAEKHSAEVQRLTAEVAKWKAMYTELESNASKWKEFADAVMDQERLSASQSHEASRLLQVELETVSLRHREQIEERDEVITELRKAVESLSSEANSTRESAVQEMTKVIGDKEAAFAGEIAFLQKEIGALQVGLVLQKEMKDELQGILAHTRTCLRSLALDLSTVIHSDSQCLMKTRCLSLCDLFDRLLMAGTIGSPMKLAGEVSARLVDDVTFRTQSYLISGLKTNNSREELQNDKERQAIVQIDPDFLGVVRSLKEILHKVAADQASLDKTKQLSGTAKSEITRLVERLQLLHSDLQESDKLVYSVVRQLADEMFVDIAGLKDLMSAPARGQEEEEAAARDGRALRQTRGALRGLQYDDLEQGFRVEVNILI